MWLARPGASSRCDDFHVTAIPPAMPPNRYLQRMNRRLDISFGVDLGELVEGHHAVTRGGSVEVPHYDHEAALGWARRTDLRNRRLIPS
jgi:hypothetical protein